MVPIVIYRMPLSLCARRVKIRKHAQQRSSPAGKYFFQVHILAKRSSGDTRSTSKHEGLFDDF